MPDYPTTDPGQVPDGLVGGLDELLTRIEGQRGDRERDAILAEAAVIISGDREAAYGSARDGFTRTGEIWGAILGIDPITAEVVALMLAGLKISRLATNTGHRDSWVDGAGYFALGGDIAAETRNETEGTNA